MPRMGRGDEPRGTGRRCHNQTTNVASIGHPHSTYPTTHHRTYPTTHHRAYPRTHHTTTNHTRAQPPPHHEAGRGPTGPKEEADTGLDSTSVRSKKGNSQRFPPHRPHRPRRGNNQRCPHHQPRTTRNHRARNGGSTASPRRIRKQQKTHKPLSSARAAWHSCQWKPR